MKNFVLALIVVAAIIFIICSACSWSNGNIGLGQMFIQVGIGLIVEWCAFKSIDM